MQGQDFILFAAFKITSSLVGKSRIVLPFNQLHRVALVINLINVKIHLGSLHKAPKALESLTDTNRVETNFCEALVSVTGVGKLQGKTSTRRIAHLKGSLDGGFREFGQKTNQIAEEIARSDPPGMKIRQFLALLMTFRFLHGY